MFKFHGGCGGCEMQSKKNGLAQCTRCHYFELDNTLPILNQSHIKRENELAEMRKKAITMAKLLK